MDKSRQQFEEAIKQLSDPSEFESKLKRANNGLNYADQYVDLMWISCKHHARVWKKNATKQSDI